MLAPEEDGDLDLLRFSLASDIVELVVLTDDEPFLQTMRDAVGETRRVWHVPTSDKVGDLLVAGEVGILVLDAPALHASAAPFIGQIKRQFPDLVVVVAGNRDDETSLAGLISAGIVYRFIHKPMSPARARLFADAAVKRFEEQRRRVAQTPPAAHTTMATRGLLIGGVIGALALILAVTWALHPESQEDSASQRAPVIVKPPPALSPLLAQAAAALTANRLTEPSGDNALELYGRELARDPLDAAARAGLAEVRERLLARAENALLEERLDEAAGAIETARKSGVESGRIAFLTAQLAKSREQIKAAQARAAKSEAKDDAGSAAAQDTEQSLAMRLLTEARGAIDRRDFPNAAARLEAANGIAAPANIEVVQQLLKSARLSAETDSVQQLLKTANERLQQDRLIQPANDSAKYYLLTARGLDPANTGLAAAMQDLGARLIAKARRALALAQFEAARSWLDETTAIGFSSPDATAALQDLDRAVAKQKFLSDVVSASDLTLLKSVQPKYPQKAELNKVQGWVELDFTVAATGEVMDIAVHAANAPGVFEEAAISALSQWRYQPMLRDAKPVPQRVRIRIRFSLAP